MGMGMSDSLATSTLLLESQAGLESRLVCRSNSNLLLLLLLLWRLLSLLSLLLLVLLSSSIFDAQRLH